MTTDLQPGGFHWLWGRIPSGAPRGRGPRWLFQRATKLVIWAYMRIFHDFRVRYSPEMPRGKPYIVVMCHTSMLDVPALMAADPYDPPTRMIIKAEIIEVPVLGWILRQWGAIPVVRRGEDVTAVREIVRVLRAGQGICVAPQGTRSPDGRLGPVNPVLARLIVSSDVPVFPAVIVGSLECLPKGAKLPRPGRVYVETGAAIDLQPFRGHRLSEKELYEAAMLIRDAIADLLPEHMKPHPHTPVLGTYVAETQGYRSHVMRDA